MNKTTSFLSKATGFFFGLGFAIAQLRYLPIPILTSFLTLASLLSCMIAYGLWFIESHLHPEHTKKLDRWFGFAQYKEQHLLASLFGLMATTLSIAAIFAPVLIIPAIWLIFASNLLWSIGEYHKLKNPPPSDERFLEGEQRSYFSYSAAMVSVALISAISETITFLFPPAIFITVFIASSLCIGIGAVGAGYWLDYCFNYPKEEAVVEEEYSYEQMTRSLGPSEESGNKLHPAPYHAKGLYAPEIELAAIKQVESNSRQTCLMT